jgi:hypothetical protein
MRALLATPQKLPVLLAISAGIAVLFCLSLFELPFLAGTSAFWNNPRGVIAHSWGDMSTSISGVLFFEQDRWRLPLFQVAKLAAPEGTNIIVTDSVPLLALVARMLFRLTGQTINPFGAWAAFCFIGSALSFTWLVSLLGRRTPIEALAATVIALTMPVLLYRWGHLALFAQFEIALALALYVHSRHTTRPAVTTIAMFGLSAASLWTQVYLFLMVTGILAAALIQSGLDRRERPVVAAIKLAAMAVLIVALGKVSGHFDLPGPASAEGFGVFSLNLLSPIVPQRSGLVPSMARLVLDGTGGQYEGFSYFGAGVLLLLAFAAPSLAHQTRQCWRRHIVLVLGLAGFAAVALTNDVYLGPWRVLHIPLPHTLVALAGVVRSSGRFIWPLLYLTNALAIAQASRLGAVRGAALLLAAILLQWVDTAPLRTALSASIAAPAPSPMPGAPLNAAIAANRMITVLPSYACLRALEGPDKEITLQVQLAASRLNIATNTLYAGRAAPDCDREAARTSLPTPGGGEATLYLPDYPAFTAVHALATSRPDCQSIAAYVLCGLPAADGLYPTKG